MHLTHDGQNKTRHDKLPLPDATVAALIRLGAVLRRIHERLIREGYVIKDGQLIHPRIFTMTKHIQNPEEKIFKEIESGGLATVI